MSLFNIPLPAISDVALKTFLASNPGTNKEGLTIDFKADTQLGDEKQKQKLLKFVASFANTAGGDIIIGVSQEDGTNYEICGIPEGVNTDNLQLQISSIVNTGGIEPKLSRPIEFKEIPIDGTKVLIVRTHQSFNKPHGVKVNDGYKFFIRLPNGQSLAMDIQQIRSAMIGSETLIQQLKAFKADRIGSLISNNGPFEMLPEPKVVIHVMPLEAFSQNLYIDPQRIDPHQAADIVRSFMAPVRANGWDWRYNFEGFANHSIERASGLNQSYTQFFRNGAIEFAFVCASRPQGEIRYIPSLANEQEIGNAVKKAIGIYNYLDLAAPYMVSITFLDAKDCHLGIGPQYSTLHNSRALGKEVLYLPDIRIDVTDANIFEALKPAFDTFWQCFGYERSGNYNDQGQWSPNL